ncbi:response regulator transcription factor [Salinibacter altiplanensis]|uniref:response regulator transcription factor n=1 Tax=Salinibacter altiplanensis TaxID=1803181 RepID=UPI000C9F9B45|nr:response regulator transcription factor [Salinibacter altiplanensis]
MTSEAVREKTQIIVVDKHPAIREVLQSRIAEHPEMQLEAESANSEEALALAERHDPDVVVVEISLGDADGLTLIQEIRSQMPEVRILVFSKYNEDLYAERAIEAGASGYVMKTKPTEEVMQAIELVSEGQVFLSRHVSSRILSRLVRGSGDAETSPLEKLTDRELTVFRKIGEGHSVRQIADQLDLNRKTIETYRRRAKEKLGHETVEDLLRHAVQWAERGTREQTGSE